MIRCVVELDIDMDGNVQKCAGLVMVSGGFLTNLCKVK